jgi:hypothetical protein
VTEPLFDDAPATRRATKYGLNDAETRYMYPPPPFVPTPKPWIGWMRATNLVGAFSDQKRLQNWLEWKGALGLLANEGTLFDEMAAAGVEYMTVDDQRAWVEKHMERARQAAGAQAAADRGTARHAMLEGYLNTGQVNGHRRMRVQMESLLEAMEANELDFLDGWSERRVWHPAGGGTMGTLDARVMDRRTGRVGILDLKTQARFWTYQEICGQQALYDDAPWAWEGPADDTGRWVKAPANNLLGHPEGEFKGKRVALLAHMPQQPGPGQLPVEIHEVDVEYGREVLAVAAENVRLRSIGKSVAKGRRVGNVRPPSAVARLA